MRALLREDESEWFANHAAKAVGFTAGSFLEPVTDEGPAFNTPPAILEIDGHGSRPIRIDHRSRAGDIPGPGLYGLGVFRLWLWLPTGGIGGCWLQAIGCEKGNDSLLGARVGAIHDDVNAMSVNTENLTASASMFPLLYGK